MAKGDHLYVSRGTYFHHGIDCGDGTVIHYREGESITRSSEPFFALGETVQVKFYPAADPPNLVVERAESRLGERDYHLVFNNCEHFAVWCKTGKHRSEQVETVAAATALGGVLLGGVFVAPAIAAAGIYGISKYLEQAKATEDPLVARRYLGEAMAQLAEARQEQATAIAQLQQEIESWVRTAQEAIHRDREDLARAALARKYPLVKQLDQHQQQLAEITSLEAQLRQRLALD
jgi:hypothetical protein